MGYRYLRPFNRVRTDMKLTEMHTGRITDINVYGQDFNSNVKVRTKDEQSCVKEDRG